MSKLDELLVLGLIDPYTYAQEKYREYGCEDNVKRNLKFSMWIVNPLRLLQEE